MVWAAIGASSFEVIYITLQGARGLPSHFNTSAFIYAVMYQMMGFGAVVLTSASLVLGVVIAVLSMVKVPQRFASPAVWVFSTAFSALCLGTFAQAVGGKPFLAALH